jgi:hypothetical protein
MKFLMDTIDSFMPRNPRRPVYRPRVLNRVPETPIGFVPRSDPNFYFLCRKF